MRYLFSLSLLCLVGCGDTTNNGNPDLAATVGCEKSLAAGCVGQTCPSTLAAARPAFCDGSPQSDHDFLSSAPCQGLQQLIVAGVDTATVYYYDAGGLLVAVVAESANFGGSSVCIAGPSTFVVPTGCTTNQLALCSPVDGGHD